MASISTLVSYIDLTQCFTGNHGRGLGSRLVSKSANNVFAGLLIASILISAIFLAIAYSPEEGAAVNSAVGNESNEWRAFSVIAPIDTGINVYHDHFRTNETYPQWLLDDLGVNKVCDLTFNGSWQEKT